MNTYQEAWENDPRARAARATAHKTGGAFQGHAPKERSSWWLVVGCLIIAVVAYAALARQGIEL